MSNIQIARPTEATGILAKDEWDVDDVLHQIQKIQQLMAKAMKDGEHYGIIPGTQKPTLLKPGAEKLCMMFRLAPDYQSVESYDGKHLTVKAKCVLVHITTGAVMGSGEGSCSTKESKYAYRRAKRLCPKCGAETIHKSKFPPKGAAKGAKPGWYCYSKVGGCGAEFDAEDTAITGQDVGRAMNEDLPDAYNTILKMANKRSLVAAVLNVTAASDIFTQDLEDIPPSQPPVDVTPPRQPATTMPPGSQGKPQGERPGPPPASALPPPGAAPPAQTPETPGTPGPFPGEHPLRWWPECVTQSGTYRQAFDKLQVLSQAHNYTREEIEAAAKKAYGKSGMKYLSAANLDDLRVAITEDSIPRAAQPEGREPGSDDIPF